MALKTCKPLRLECQSILNAGCCRPQRQASILLSKRPCTWMEATASLPAATTQRLRLKPCASTPLCRSSPLLQQLPIARKPLTLGFSFWKNARRRGCNSELTHGNSPTKYACRAKGMDESELEGGDAGNLGSTPSELCDVHQVPYSRNPVPLLPIQQPGSALEIKS